MTPQDLKHKIVYITLDEVAARWHKIKMHAINRDQVMPFGRYTELYKGIFAGFDGVTMEYRITEPEEIL